MAKKRQSPNQASKLDPIHPNAAGIDIGAQNHWVCVPSGRANECVRRFGCYTADLYAIADWLTESGVETVAMESTGVLCTGFRCFKFWRLVALRSSWSMLTMSKLCLDAKQMF